MTDRLKNKRSMVVFLLGFISVCYIGSSVFSMMGQESMSILIVLIGLATGGMALCTSTWPINADLEVFLLF